MTYYRLSVALAEMAESLGLPRPAVPAETEEEVLDQVANLSADTERRLPPLKSWDDRLPEWPDGLRRGWHQRQREADQLPYDSAWDEAHLEQRARQLGAYTTLSDDPQPGTEHLPPPERRVPWDVPPPGEYLRVGENEIDQVLWWCIERPDRRSIVQRALWELQALRIAQQETADSQPVRERLLITIADLQSSLTKYQVAEETHRSTITGMENRIYDLHRQHDELLATLEALEAERDDLLADNERLEEKAAHQSALLQGFDPPPLIAPRYLRPDAGLDETYLPLYPTSVDMLLKTLDDYFPEPQRPLVQRALWELQEWRAIGASLVEERQTLWAQVKALTFMQRRRELRYNHPDPHVGGEYSPVTADEIEHALRQASTLYIDGFCVRDQLVLRRALWELAERRAIEQEE